MIAMVIKCGSQHSILEGIDPYVYKMLVITRSIVDGSEKSSVRSSKGLSSFSLKTFSF